MKCAIGPSAEFRTDDVSALAALAGVAAAAFSPVMIGASPALLEVDSFADLATSTDIAAPLRNADHARWRSLPSRADMRFVGVALPRVLARAALGGRRHARRRLPLRGIRADQRTTASG